MNAAGPSREQSERSKSALGQLGSIGSNRRRLLLRSTRANGEYLRGLASKKFIAVLTRWNEIFEAGGHLPVMGVTEQELAAIRAPTIVIPGNDKVHSSASGLAAHRMIPGSRLHRLPVEDQDVPLIPFTEWAPYEDEIATVFAQFIKEVSDR